MQWLRSMAREIWGLFVDDGSFAGAILAWLVVAVLVLPRIGSRWAGPVWFAGLAVILVESVARFSRRRRK
jgi:hypothetical protein